MPAAPTHLDIVKLLPKTNCTDCGFRACLAFAVAVAQGKTPLAKCPHVPPEAREGFEQPGQKENRLEEDARAAMLALKSQVAELDLPDRCEALGAKMKDGKLAVPCLSRDFNLAPDGTVSSGCHVNMWVAVPLMHYVISSQGLEPKGEWVPFRDLEGSVSWARFFEHKVEKELKRVIDGYTGLFEEMVDIFAAEPAPNLFESDIAVVLRPLPKVPVAVCYWKPEDGMESELNLFFDSTATRNLPVDYIYNLCAGMVTMFDKIARTHGK